MYDTRLLSKGGKLRVMIKPQELREKKKNSQTLYNSMPEKRKKKSLSS